jgi:short-subunit dehydrogenase
MAKTIVVCGFGPGISTGVAEKFGKEGFQVALVARNKERLDAGVKALGAKGIKAAAFPTDLYDPTAAAGLAERVRSSLGPISVIHWNAYGGRAGDLVAADADAIRAEMDIALVSPMRLISAALPDMKKSDGAAVLLTNGGFGKLNKQADEMAVQFNAMGLAIANAAKDKLAGLLSEKLRADNVYVTEVIIMGTVKGTAWDQGNASLEPSAIGEKFWSLYKARTEVRVDFS